MDFTLGCFQPPLKRDVLGLNGLQRSRQARQLLPRFQPSEAFCRFDHAGGRPAQGHACITPSFDVAADAPDGTASCSPLLGIMVALKIEPVVPKCCRDCPRHQRRAGSGQACDRRAAGRLIVGDNPVDATSLGFAPVQDITVSKWEDQRA